MSPPNGLSGALVGGPAERETEIRPWHNNLTRRAVIGIQLHSAGMTNKEIAQRLNVQPATVSIWLSHPDAQRVIQSFASRVADQIEDVHVKLQLVAPEALDKVVETMRSTDDDRVRAQTAFGLLDRAGYGKIEKRVALGGQLTDEQVARLTKSLEESARVTQEISYQVEAPEIPGDDEDG